MAQLLDGRPVAAAHKREIQAAVAALAVPPTLAVVQVGNDAAADWYVRSIKRASEGVGMRFQHLALAGDSSQARVVAGVAALSADPGVHGIIVQLPLPKPLNPQAVLAALDPRKDVDGAHPVNAGRLMQGLPALLPNTPAGGMEILRHYAIAVAGKHAVVIGRSAVVGKPLALLLLQADATVTICHSRTPNLGAFTRQADVVAVAVGQPGLVTGAMLKPGAVVLDFGINDQDGAVVGDVEWASAEAVAGAITPVPGGTGPVTNMLLLRNTLEAYRALQHA